MSDATTGTVSLLDMLDGIGASLDEEQRQHEEQQELLTIGRNAMFPDLYMTIHTVCAERGIDWSELLAAAVRKGLNPGPPQ